MSGYYPDGCTQADFDRAMEGLDDPDEQKAEAREERNWTESFQENPEGMTLEEFENAIDGRDFPEVFLV